MHFLFCDRIQKDCSPLSAACINDLPAWAKSLVSLPRALQLFTIFCLLLYLENLYLLSLHLFSFLHFVKLIICISFFWPLALMICPPERNPLYPSFASSSPLYPFTSSSIWNFYIFLTERKVSFSKVSCCLFALLIYNCWQQSGTNPINCFSIRQICQIPPNPNKFPTTRISRFCNKKCTFFFFLCVLLNNFFVW